MENNRNDSKGYLLPLTIIASLFFIFGFVTWVNGTLIPYLKISCELTKFQSSLVATAFYIAYFVMALPSSWVLGKVGYKRGMSLGLFIMAIGAAIFIPAAQNRSYFTFLVGLFTQGMGLTLLQTASNPYVTILGPIDRAAQRISIMGICNKVAGAIGSVSLAKIVLTGSDELQAKLATISVAEKNLLLDQMAAKVVEPYIFISIAFAVVAIGLNFTPLPEINMSNESENGKKEEAGDSIFKYTYLFLGALALFLYVGAEVIAGDFIIDYGISYWKIPVEESKYFTMYILIAMVGTYLAGVALIPKYLSQENALKLSALLGMILTVGVVTTSEWASIYFVVALGVANALVWPAIWPLAIKDLGAHIKTGSAILIMAIVGGALLTPIFGSLGDTIGMQQAYWLLFPCYAFILFFAVKGHKIGIQKKTKDMTEVKNESLKQVITPSKNGKELESVLK